MSLFEGIPSTQAHSHVWLEAVARGVDRDTVSLPSLTMFFLLGQFLDFLKCYVSSIESLDSNDMVARYMYRRWYVTRVFVCRGVLPRQRMIQLWGQRRGFANYLPIIHKDTRGNR